MLVILNKLNQNQKCLHFTSGSVTGENIFSCTHLCIHRKNIHWNSKVMNQQRKYFNMVLNMSFSDQHFNHIMQRFLKQIAAVLTKMNLEFNKEKSCLK